MESSAPSILVLGSLFNEGSSDGGGNDGGMHDGGMHDGRVSVT